MPTTVTLGELADRAEAAHRSQLIADARLMALLQASTRLSAAALNEDHRPDVGMDRLAWESGYRAAYRVLANCARLAEVESTAAWALRRDAEEAMAIAAAADLERAGLLCRAVRAGEACDGAAN